MKTTLTTTAIALLSFFVFLGTANAQTPKVKKKIPTKITKPKLKKVKKPKKVALNLTGKCHKQTAGSTERNYKATCLTGPKSGKKIMCNGSQEVSSGSNRYRRMSCQVLRSSQPNRFRVSRAVNSSNSVTAKRAADFACGCGPDVARQTCSGGECSVSDND